VQFWQQIPLLKWNFIEKYCDINLLQITKAMAQYLYSHYPCFIEKSSLYSGALKHAGGERSRVIQAKEYTEKIRKFSRKEKMQ
jgi:hypothetical protein